MSVIRTVMALACAAMLASAAPAPGGIADSVILAEGYPRSLSEFGFFTGKGISHPSAHLVGYSLRTPLFSDYAHKERFIYVPANQRIAADPHGRLDFPVGSALIKTFGYGEAAQFRPIETRVLLRRAAGWVALPYVWKPDLSDAELKLAGTRIAVDVARPAGVTETISYAVPNKNQCKECHSRDGAVVPIGPIAANMDVSPIAVTAFRNRIDWAQKTTLGSAPVWNDPASGSLDVRARAYLAVNCAHCHNPQGAASNSGLFLNPQAANDSVATGIYKRPVAAGRGSGGLDFAIAPGDPDHSIALYRMRSTEPGIAMPEVGRSMVHDEGVALIRDWISSLPPK